MNNAVIYEKPRLGVLGAIRLLWDYAVIDKKGFIDEYKNKIGDIKCMTDVKRKEEKEKEVIKDERIQTRSKKTRKVQKKTTGTQRQNIPTSSGNEKKEILNFFDFKTRKKFSTNAYEYINNKHRTWAVAISPDGNKSQRLVKRIQ